MRDNDFTLKVRNVALKRARFRCERCWDDSELEFHHITPIVYGGKSSLENCVVLCSECHRIAPKNPLIFEKMFMRFASLKEMMVHYNVKNKIQAIEKFADEISFTKEDVLDALKEGQSSRKDLIKEGMTKKAKAGKLMGFNAPYGYDLKNGKLLINKTEAEVVKEIFAYYMSGKTMKKIAHRLNSQNIKTRNKKKWSVWSVSYILHNPVYAGFIKWEDTLSVGHHSPIIEKERFNKVQRLISKQTPGKRIKDKTDIFSLPR